MPTAAALQQTSLPTLFTSKKAQILESLATSTSPDYTDKSPKGSVDSDIIDLIDLINSFQGYVTTSSCAGRVAVFVEGRKSHVPSRQFHHDAVEGEVDAAVPVIDTRSGPGGKGAGNRWLYVSHSPVTTDSGTGHSTGISDHGNEHMNAAGDATQLHTFHELFKLTPQSDLLGSSISGAQGDGVLNQGEAQYPGSSDIRLVKLSFSPLILHILCSSLRTAKPLLAAAINAGFRESGVQSLKALDDEEAGVMVAIRTAGLSFETVVGWVDEHQSYQQHENGKSEDTVDQAEDREIYRSCVSEGLLKMLVGVANDRFGWNEQRRERLRTLLQAIGEEKLDGDGAWEDKAVRRERKREEGLKRKMEKEKDSVEGGLSGHAKKTEIESEIFDDMALFEDIS